MTQPPTQPSPRETRLSRRAHRALSALMSQPGWVEALLEPPQPGEERALGVLRVLIIRLFRDVIERQGTALAAQWRRERDQRGRMRLMRGGRERQSRVRLIKGRRVRCSLRARRRASPPVTGPRAT